ncbi:MAG: hypothetical protein H7246_07380 [Phycisphaerae bacterium]|nr:hypothetical protein [Saprospiraceae bacterium]
MKRLLITISLAPFVLYAQQSVAKIEIEQINRTYAAMTTLHTEVDYLMFATYDSDKPVESQHATLWRNGDDYLYKLNPIETLTTPEYTLTADQEDKSLMIDRVRGNPAEKQFGIDLSTALGACAAVTVLSPSPGIRLIRLDWPSTDMERVDLQFDAMSRKMMKVTLYYSEAEAWQEDQPPTKARMEIIYRKQDERPAYPKNLFSFDRFVVKTNGVLAPAPAFRGYELMDNTGF